MPNAPDAHPLLCKIHFVGFASSPYPVEFHIEQVVEAFAIPRGVKAPNSRLFDSPIEHVILQPNYSIRDDHFPVQLTVVKSAFDWMRLLE